MRKTQRKIINVLYLYMRYRFPFIYVLNNIFDFLYIHNEFFESYFANELILDRSFLKQFKTFAVRVLSDHLYI